MICFFSLLLSSSAFAQPQVDNVRFVQQGDQVIITYDLHGSARDFTITLELSTDDGRTYTQTPKTLRGDVGDNVRPGRGKQIVWEAIQDAKGLTGHRFVFRVTAQSALGASFTNSIGVKFVLIPSGEFMMGSKDTGGDSDEQPVHRVRISRPFYMGIHEVTQRQWEAVMGSNPSHFKGADRPVEQVSWVDVQTFIGKLNDREGRNVYRLPTEAEWEYACRAGTTGAYAGDLASMGWYADNSDNRTHPVGRKRANAWGLYDMHGNVWEWVGDWYAGNYYKNSPRADPIGPSSGSYRVLRGGGWNLNAALCRSADRNLNAPVVRYGSLGFRLVRTAD